MGMKLHLFVKELQVYNTPCNPIQLVFGLGRQHRDDTQTIPLMMMLVAREYSDLGSDR